MLLPESSFLKIRGTSIDKDKTMHDINIEFIAKSENALEAADIIAESIMSEYGTDDRGFWNMANKDLLSLLLLYTAKGKSVSPENRTCLACEQLIAEPEAFADAIHEEILSNPGSECMSGRYQAWIGSENSGETAACVRELLARANN